MYHAGARGAEGTSFPWGDEPDQPLSLLFDIEADPVLDLELGFGSPDDLIVRLRRNLMAAAWTGHLQGQWVHVSFSRDWYALPFLRLKFATYRAVVELGVKALAREGLILLEVAPQQPPEYRGVRWRTRFTLSPTGEQLCRSAALNRQPLHSRDLKGSRVRLFDRTSHEPLPLPGTEKQASIERHLCELTERTRSVSLVVGGRSAVTQIPDPASHTGAWVVDLTNAQWRASYLRKKTDQRKTLIHSGRPTGHWVQTLPRRLRHLVRIDGMPVAEADIAASHLSIIFALRGRPAPVCPYEALADRVGFSRGLAKMATVILVNAKSRPSAVRAMAFQCAAARLGLPAKTPAQCATVGPPIGEDRCRAGVLVSAAEDLLADIAPAFFSDMGVTCMAVEADILRFALTILWAKGISAVPMHDALMVGVPYREDAMNALMAASKAVTRVEFRITAK